MIRYGLWIMDGVWMSCFGVVSLSSGLGGVFFEVFFEVRGVRGVRGEIRSCVSSSSSSVSNNNIYL